MKKIKNSNKGFSLVELIVVIAIMAVMTAVLAPALLQYVEKSRAQKDDSAMGEVVEVVKLALADQDVYDECLCYTVEGNKANYKIGNDEEPLELEGAMRGLTITFHADKSANATKFNLSAGKVNEFIDDSSKGFNGGNPKSTLGAMTANNVTNELYTKVKAGIEDGEVDLTSQTYRNSDYTIFITMGAADEAVNVYGQWGGTNLASGVVGDDNQEEPCTKSNDCKAEEHDEGCPAGQSGSQAVGCDTLYWDGNTDGKAVITTGGMSFYKISDYTPTLEDVLQGFTGCINLGNGNSQTVALSTEQIQGMLSTYPISEDGTMFLDAVFIVPSDNCSYKSTVFPEKGVYAFCVPAANRYLSSFKINGYTGFEHSANCGH